MSVTLENYRYDHWDDLSAKQRLDLEDNQWTLFNKASDLNARSVLLKIKLIEKEIDVRTLRNILIMPVRKLFMLE